MSIDNKATLFLKAEVKASNGKFKLNDCMCGDIELADAKGVVGGGSKAHFSTGSVYGIFVVETDKGKMSKLFEEVGNEVESIDQAGTIYPIYWGKDIHPGSRILAHARHNPGTGNAELEKIKALRDLNLIYGCVYVTTYDKFEQHLHTTYKPLLGTSGSGKKTIWSIVDK